MNGPAQRRAVALAILAGVVALMAAAVAVPVTAVMTNRQDRVDVTLEALAANRKLAAARPHLEQELLILRQSSPPGFVEAGSAAQAAAFLQTEVKSVIERNGGEVRTVQPLPSTAVDKAEKIEVRYEFSATQPALAEMLMQIEAHMPMLFIDGVDIQAPQGVAPADVWEQRAGEQRAGEPRVSVRWIVNAYRWTANP